MLMFLKYFVQSERDANEYECLNNAAALERLEKRIRMSVSYSLSSFKYFVPREVKFYQNNQIILNMPPVMCSQPTTQAS